MTAATALLFSACAVGPDFERPPAPGVASYESTPQSDKTTSVKTTGGDQQSFVPGSEVSAEWWKLFSSAPLNDLIELSLKNNPDLAVAQPEAAGNASQ